MITIMINQLIIFLTNFLQVLCTLFEKDLYLIYHVRQKNCTVLFYFLQ